MWTPWTRIQIARVLASDLTEGISRAVHQDTARAERLIREALERDPNRSQAHLIMGQVRRVQGRWAESQAELERAIALDQNNAQAIRQLGQTALIQGHPATAIPYLEKAIRLDAPSAYLFGGYANLGRCHLFLGRTDLAADLFRQARTLAPGNWYVHLDL